eukprot:SAG22_NODE_265_length_13348_cov_150.719149_4_plen_200_part_00
MYENENDENDIPQGSAQTENGDCYYVEAGYKMGQRTATRQPGLRACNATGPNAFERDACAIRVEVKVHSGADLEDESFSWFDLAVGLWDPQGSSELDGICGADGRICDDKWFYHYAGGGREDDVDPGRYNHGDASLRGGWEKIAGPTGPIGWSYDTEGYLIAGPTARQREGGRGRRRLSEDVPGPRVRRFTQFASGAVA